MNMYNLTVESVTSCFVFPSRSDGFALVLFILALLLWPLEVRGENDLVLFEGDSIYNHITIHQTGSERCMLFGRHADTRETCIDLNHADVSVFEYTAMMFVGFLFKPDTRSVSLIGLGGGYIPTVFSMHLPDVRLHTLEIDPLVHKLAVKYFSFQLPEKHRLTLADGRQHLRRSAELYDQIWVDAFNSDYIPAHMTTREFLLLCKSRLIKNGIVVQNVHGGNQLYDAQVTTFRSAFAHVAVIEGQVTDNRIIIASDMPFPDPEVLKERGRRFKGAIGRIDLIAELAKYNRNPEVREAPVLTDDYNPANLMLHRR